MPSYSKLPLTSQYHPHTDEQDKRTNQTVKKALIKY